MQYLTNGTLLQGGKYRIEEKIGQGGFGITYRACQPLMLERKVCIKEFCLKQHFTRESTTSAITYPNDTARKDAEMYQQKFIKEAQTLYSMHHPNIMEIYDIFEENNTAYYVMEYIEGESLKGMLERRGCIPEAEAIGYIRKVAEALKYIHSRNINHFDVKPGNILVRSSDKEIILIDFGTAKHYDSKTGSATTMSSGLLSPGYAPIEQYKQGGVSIFTPETDIYALGATLYKLLTGNTPPEPTEIISNGIPELPSSVSKATKDLIKWAMQLNKADRPHSCDEFLNALTVNGSSIIDSSTSNKEEYSIDNTEETVIINSNNEQTVLTEQTKSRKDNTHSKNNQKKSLHTGIIVACISLLFIIGGVILFSSKNSTEESAVGVITNNFDQSIIRSAIMIELDSIDMELSTLPSIAHFTKKLSSLKDKRYPQSLVNLNSVANKITKEDKRYLLIGMLYVDRSVCASFGINTDDYAKMLPADSIWVSENYYIKCKEDGIINHYWEMYAGAIIETLYLYTKNPSFLETLNDQEASDLTYRLALVKLALDDLSYYDDNIKYLNELIAPLNELNAVAVEQLRSQLTKICSQLEVIRASLLRK